MATVTRTRPIRTNTTPPSEAAQKLLELMHESPARERNFTHLLPYLLNLRGEPYTLKNHFVMEPLFRLEIPWKTVYKCGRQISKCSAVYQLIEKYNGELVEAGSVKIGDELLSMDDRTLMAVPGTVTRLWRSVRSDMFRVTTRMGSVLTISGEHKIRTLDEYTPLNELGVGSRVANLHSASISQGKYVNGQATWDTITAIEPVDECEVVDFEIDTYHNFAIDGVVTHNSTTMAAQGFIQTASMPYFNSLYVLPLYEMCRRFSSNVVRPFIEESPLKRLVVDSTCEQSVLQKRFVNNSIMFFTFAYLDCGRVRGISSDKIAVDECQDMDWDFLPIIRETAAASKWGLEQYSGTPKTFDNTLEALWDDSSQAEWFIRCGCGHWNIPAQKFDLLRMIGPVRNIAKYGTALICGKCGRPINARSGQWVHGFPERFNQFTGYHIPQILLPMHHADERKWVEFLRKRDKSAPNVFLNECLGESCDVGTKLVTLAELKRACCLHTLDYTTARALDFDKKYIQRVMGVDWGGGGQEGISFTTVAVLGLCPDYRLELIWGERMHSAVDDVEEVRRIQELFNIFQCHYLAHDFAGSGSVHETLLVQSGFPLSRIIPFSYVRTGSKALIRHHAPTATSSRHFYSLDKTWSLMLICLLLKTQHIRLTDFESSKDLVEDFLHIYEEKTETPTAGDILTVRRTPKMSDDFAHAVNFAACGHFHVTQKFPTVAEQFGILMTDEQRNVAHPSKHVVF